MTPTTDDVAGLVAELRGFIVDDPNYGEGLTMSIDATHVKRTIALLESQAKALREAEQRAAVAEACSLSAEEGRARNGRNRDMWKGQCERQAEQLTALRARLKEAEKALRPFAQEAERLNAIHHDEKIVTWIVFMAGELRAARAFLNAGEK